MQTQTSSSNWNPGLKNDAVRLGDVYDGMPKDPASAVPWYVRMLENPASPLALPGAIDLFGHDCLHALLGRGHRVLVLDNLCSGSRANLHPDAELIEGDLRDGDLLRSIFARGIETVIHHAAQNSVRHSVDDEPGGK